MQKIIAVYDGLKYSKSTSSYAIWVANQMAGRLTGVFLEDTRYHNFRLSDVAGEENGYVSELAQHISSDKADREYTVSLFTEACKEAGIPAVIHRDRNVAMQELLHESRFSDLMVLQNDETFANYTEQAPTTFVTRILQESECPILLVPGVFHVPEKIVFLYDGSASSIYAIKHFTYALGKIKIPIQVLSDVHTKSEKKVPDKHLFFEWLQHHYDKFDYKVLRGKAQQEITDELMSDLNECIVVLGAYHRKALSRAIRPSMADVIIRQINVPVFVYHK